MGWKDGLSKQQIHDKLEAWGLEDPVIRDRHKAVKGETVRAEFRMSMQNHRVLSEIVASQQDHRLKTLTDCMQDALAMFIEDWFLNYQDQGLSGRPAREWELENRSNARANRKRYLDKIDTDIDEASKEQDKEGLQRTLIALYAEREEDEEQRRSPDSYIKELDKRIDKLKRILD